MSEKINYKTKLTASLLLFNKNKVFMAVTVMNKDWISSMSHLVLQYTI